MYVHCPVCDSIMDGKMFCKKCSLQIDRVNRIAYFSGGDNSYKSKYEWMDTIDWKNMPSYEGYMVLGVVIPMFEERLEQIFELGAGMNAIYCLSKSNYQRYLFELWCLRNRKSSTEETKKLVQLYCSPTMEEKVNRVWKVFPEASIEDRHGLDAVHGFVVNPTSIVEPAGLTGKESYDVFVNATIPSRLKMLTRLVPQSIVNVEFFKDWYKSQASVVLNEFKSCLIADVPTYVVPPNSMSKSELETFAQAKKTLNPIVEEVITEDYIRSYGVNAKRAVLESWRVGAGSNEEVVLMFWQTLYTKVKNGELERR